ELIFNSKDNVLVAATYGRGVWTVPAALIPLTQHAVLTLPGTASGDNDWTISRDRTTPWLIQVRAHLAGTGQTFIVPFQLTSLEQIVIQGGADGDTVTIDPANGPINLSV